jgi:CheY-like chemotaxis protein
LAQAVNAPKLPERFGVQASIVVKRTSPMPASIRPKVLIVEDEPAQLRLLSLYLMRHCSVVSAPDAKTAVRHLESGRLDAILCDYAMPDRNGMWLLEQARIKAPDAIRVLFSGRDLPMLKEHLRSGLVHRFLPKPVVAKDLLACLGIRDSASSL